VDSILIDEARTPLIISGQSEDNVQLYYALNEIAPKLKRQAEEKGEGDYWVDEKAHQVLLSEQGHEHAEQILASAGLLAPGRPLRCPQHRLMHTVCGIALMRCSTATSTMSCRTARW
jgi:preprotein translocase subunit SecA